MLEGIKLFWSILVESGIVVAAVGFLFWRLKKYIDKRDDARIAREHLLEAEKKKDAADLEAQRAKRQKELAEKEEEKLDLIIKQTSGILASITLGIATAEAIQDGHCNGNVTTALKRGAVAKEEIETLLLKKGISDIQEKKGRK
jgi:hypothetical protein